MKERGMESKLPPTATPEQLKECCENCKVVPSERVSHFCDGGKGLQGTVSTWASRASWDHPHKNSMRSMGYFKLVLTVISNKLMYVSPEFSCIVSNLARFSGRPARRSAD